MTVLSCAGGHDHFRFGVSALEGVSHVLDLSEGSSKLVPIDEQPNHQIVHLFRLGKANRGIRLTRDG